VQRLFVTANDCRSHFSLTNQVLSEALLDDRTFYQLLSIQPTCLTPLRNSVLASIIEGLKTQRTNNAKSNSGKN
jgi:hypothetical protein